MLPRVETAPLSLPLKLPTWDSVSEAAPLVPVPVPVLVPVLVVVPVPVVRGVVEVLLIIVPLDVHLNRHEAKLLTQRW